MNNEQQWIAFAGTKKIASGDPMEVATAVKKMWDDGIQDILILNAVTSQVVELDISQKEPIFFAQVRSEIEYWNRASKPAVKKGPGRPKLGVMAREVTLLPRHWEWLAAQPGGASVTLRKLVEHARTANTDQEQQRKQQEAAYRFMTTMAGDLPHYEEALRALFANDRKALEEKMHPWPEDIQAHVRTLVKPVTASE